MADSAAGMKRVALALLAGAAALAGLALWGARAHPHPAWGYLAAGSEAAMVGALADWFAVVALFRRPLGLPIPHTAVIAGNQARIGRNLARFFCDNFLATPQVLARLERFDPARRLAGWLADPAHAGPLAQTVAQLLRQALDGLDAQDEARLQAALARALRAGLARADLARLSGRVLQALREEGRHQALLDDVLGRLATLLDDEALQAQLTEAIAREVKALRYLGLDQVAARLATRKIVAAVAATLAETAAAPAHPLRLRFDAYMADFVLRLQHDPAFIARGERLRAELLAHPSVAAGVERLWRALLRGLRADLAREDSRLRQRLAALLAALGRRLADDVAARAWIDARLRAVAPRAIARYREGIRRYIEERVAGWDTQALVAQVEHNIGRDLQFIRINGTVVGALAGLGIHAVTQLWA